jgi:hypothetical protein
MGHRYAPGPKPSSGRATTHGSGEARYRTEQAENAPRRVTANPRIVAAGFCDRAMSLPNYRNLSAYQVVARRPTAKHGSGQWHG